MSKLVDERVRDEELRILIILYIAKHSVLKLFDSADRDLNMLVRAPCLAAQTLLSEREPIEIPVGNSVVKIDYEVLEPVVKTVADIMCTEARHFRPFS